MWNIVILLLRSVVHNDKILLAAGADAFDWRRSSVLLCGCFNRVSVRININTFDALLIQYIFVICRWIAAYNILPETEGRTLEAIEAHFSKKQHRMTDRTIPITVYSTRL